MDVARAISSLSLLHSLKVVRCNVGDEFLSELRGSSSLRKLHIGNCTAKEGQCGFTVRGVFSIASIKHLEELRIGSFPRDADDEHLKTSDTLKELLKNLKHLKALEMAQPTLQ